LRQLDELTDPFLQRFDLGIHGSTIVEISVGQLITSHLNVVVAYCHAGALAAEVSSPSPERIALDRLGVHVGRRMQRAHGA
jgi:hypothetical protein